MTASRILFSVFTFAILFFASSLHTHAFSDVSSSHENSTAINALADAGILNGYDDGTFKPSQSVNRVEALKMILTAASISASNTTGSTFSDVASGQWFAPFVYTAASQGIVNGNGNTGTFSPARTVIKAEFLKMALLAFGHDVSKHTNRTNVSADTPNSAWYVPYMSYARVLLIVSPNSSNQLFPEKNLTRAECAEIVYQMLILKQGGDTQKYLRLTESELLTVLLALSGDNISSARQSVDSAVMYSGLALNTSPDVGIVQAANEIALSMQDLVSAYEAGLSGNTEGVRAYANAAKEKAGVAYTYSTSTQPIGKKVKQYANELLSQVE